MDLPLHFPGIMHPAKSIEFQPHSGANRKDILLRPELTVGHPADEFHLMNDKPEPPSMLDRFVSAHAQLLEELVGIASPIVDGIVVDLAAPQRSGREILEEHARMLMVQPRVVTPFQGRNVRMASFRWPRLAVQNGSEFENARNFVFAKARDAQGGPEFSTGFRISFHKGSRLESEVG